jgi:hypothetical protein
MEILVNFLVFAQGLGVFVKDNDIKSRDIRVEPQQLIQHSMVLFSSTRS